MTSVQPSELPAGTAQSIQNVRVEDGALHFRYGWGSVAMPALPGTLQNVCFVEGYDDSTYTLHQAYIVFMQNGYYVQAYEVSPSGTYNLLSAPGGAAGFVPGDWQAIALGSTCYLFATSTPGTVSSYVAHAGDPPIMFRLRAVEYTLGQFATLTYCDLPQLPTPPNPPNIVFSELTGYGEGTSNQTLWTQLISVGADATNPAETDAYVNPIMTVNGSGTALALALTGNIVLVPSPYGWSAMTNGMPWDGIFDVLFTFQPQNWSAGIGVQFEITAPTTWQDSSGISHAMNWISAVQGANFPGSGLYSGPQMIAYFVNQAGARVQCNVTVSLSLVAGQNVYTVTLTVPSASIGTFSMTAITGVRIRHVCDDGTLGSGRWIPNYQISLSPMSLVYAATSTLPTGQFGVSYYDSTRNSESQVLAVSPWYSLNNEQWISNLSGLPLGGNAHLTEAQSGLAPQCTNANFYWQFNDDLVWHYLGQVPDDGATGIDVIANVTMLRSLEARVASPAIPINGPSCAEGCLGSIIWGYAKGAQNIQVSSTGDPLRLYNAAIDRATDPLRGGSYTLSDDFNDSPLWIGAQGQTIVILGAKAAYWMQGSTAYGMTSPVRVSNARGILGRAACWWATSFGVEMGYPSVVWVGKDQEVYEMSQAVVSQGEYARAVTELSRNVRGLVRSFLTQTDNPDRLQIKCFVDWRTDSLWLTYANRAMVYRRPSMIDGDRAWECYVYDTASFVRWCPARDWGLRAFDNSGRMFEVEYNSSSNFSKRNTAGRDNGLEPTLNSAWFWSADVLSDETRTRWFKIGLHRQTRPNPTTAVVYSQDYQGTRQNTVAWQADQLYARVSGLAIGNRHSIQLYVQPTDVIEQLDVEVNHAGRSTDR